MSSKSLTLFNAVYATATAVLGRWAWNDYVHTDEASSAMYASGAICEIRAFGGDARPYTARLVKYANEREEWKKRSLVGRIVYSPPRLGPMPDEQ